MMRMWITALCFFQGITKDEFTAQMQERYRPTRRQERQTLRYKNKPVPPARNTGALKPLIPRELGVVLTPNQIRERITRISASCRFRIYNFLYYRWDFWRKGAVKLRAQAPKGAAGPIPSFTPCGFSDAHILPD